jgi:hypothetical protein
VLAKHTLNATEESVLLAWLAGHRELRRAVIADCRCGENIASIRDGFRGSTTPVPDYDPYTVEGDFNDDGSPDFAVILIDTRRQKAPHALVIFNGPLRPSSKPALFLRDLDMESAGLYYWGPKPFRLVIGPFESDDISTFQPHRRTYTLESPRPPGN